MCFRIPPPPPPPTTPPSSRDREQKKVTHNTVSSLREKNRKQGIVQSFARALLVAQQIQAGNLCHFKLSCRRRTTFAPHPSTPQSHDLEQWGLLEVWSWMNVISILSRRRSIANFFDFLSPRNFLLLSKFIILLLPLHDRYAQLEQYYIPTFLCLSLLLFCAGYSREEAKVVLNFILILLFLSVNARSGTSAKEIYD